MLIGCLYSQLNRLVPKQDLTRPNTYGLSRTTKFTPVPSHAPYGADKDHKGNFQNDNKLFVFFVLFVVYLSYRETDQDWL